MSHQSFFKNKNLTFLLVIIPGIVMASFTLLPKPGLAERFSSFFQLEELRLPQKSTTIMIAFDYEKAWKEIDSLEQQGLPKSALKKTEVLLEAARHENQPAHFVKALIYKGKFESQLQEYGYSNAILRLESEMKKAEFPVNAILQSLLAEMYQRYLDQNYWQFSDRTKTENFKPEDITTWSLEQLTEEASRLYTASLEYEKLKEIPIDDFSLLLEGSSDTENLRPTLFDFLAHRAIDYFMDERSYLTQPAFKFHIDDESAFAPANEFIRWDITTKDTTSRKYRTLLLFQDLLSFRLNDDQPAALLDVNLKRLQFVYDNAVLDSKDDVYLQALTNLQEKYKDNPLEAEVIFKLAEFYRQKGMDYQPAPSGMKQPSDRKWYLKKAFDLCNRAIEKYPDSFGAKQCTNLKNAILEKNLGLQTEMVNLPEKPLLAKVEYRNIPEVWIKVIPFNEKRREQFEKILQEPNSDEQIIAYFNQLKPNKSWRVKLPDEGDFRDHSVEIKIDELDCGQHLIMISADREFDKEKNLTGYLFTNVSYLGFWQRQGGNEGTEFVIFDRKSGKPLKGVIAEIWVQTYNSVFRKYDLKKRATVTSEENGFVQPNLSENERNFRLLLRNGKDSLFIDENYYSYAYRVDNNPYQQTRFFLDRAIYRPGQTIYFKGMALNFDEYRMPSILKNKPVTVTLRDVNWQEVSTLKLRTNEYGTFNGQFTTPRTGLTGNMQIHSSIGNDNHPFRVEEYKRPKFEVVFDPVKDSYRLNDTVRLTGKALAYAGSNVDGAQVTWRVVREVRFPWLPWWSKIGYPWASESMEIANGTSHTDEEGKFAISFAALPDRNIPKDQRPEFPYTIYADITDITGETQQNTTNVTAGYLSMKADVTASGIPLGEAGINLDSLKQFEIITENLNGQPVPAQGTIMLERLRSPDQVYIERYWEKPDQQIMTAEEFKKAFPHYPWMNENEPQTWPAERKIFSEKFDTGSNTTFILPESDLTPGWYLLTLVTQDRFGEKVELKKYFNGYELDENSLPAPAIGWHTLPGSPPGAGGVYHPGEKAPLYFGTSEKVLPVLLEIEKDGKLLERKWLNIKGIQAEHFTVKEEHRGNVNYFYSWAMYNRSRNENATIQIPWNNKDLSIEYGVFRDKLRPGQQEEWVIKIKGPKNDKVAAEMVAGMYDASLDAFAVNNWSIDVWPMSWSGIRYTSPGFQTKELERILGYQYREQQPAIREYHRLNWFGWHLLANYGMVMNRDYNMADREVMMMEMAAAPAPGKMARQKDAVADSAVREESDQLVTSESKKTAVDLSGIKVRTNLNETVFFYPNLMTDEDGNVVIKFTMNEALTRWKFLGLAHTTDLQFAATAKEIFTQKELMVMPNPPRFFRENDEIEFTAKVSNLTENTVSGNAKLELKNALTGELLNWTSLTKASQVIHFTANGQQSARLAWRFKVPDIADVPVIEHTVIASSGEFSDAERSATQVVSNRMLVTESLPLPVRGNSAKRFVLQSLKNTNSKTLRHEGLTLEFTQNPAWYAIQALPYLMEYPFECNEQIFSRYYANSLATSVANSHPKIKAVFDRWRDYEPEALKSNLSKNQELKTALLEETPWVLAAQSEEMQKQNIALLFDLNRMAYEQADALKKLQERQMPGGGWAWFPGGQDNWYITQYIVEGLGHLQKLGVQDIHKSPVSWNMVQDAVRYCDSRMVEQYERLEEAVKKGNTKWEDDHLDYLSAHYLYARSFFLEDKSAQATSGKSIPDKDKNYIALEGKAAQVHDYYIGQAAKFWLNKSIYTEGMIGLALHRTGKSAEAQKIVKSLAERALHNEELGMYWKYPQGWWWYQAPVETHSLMIELFSDVANDPKAVDDLKVWLLKNKQTNYWKTTKATASAVYALLSTGDNWLLDSKPVQIELGNADSPEAKARQTAIAKAQTGAEAGTGYFKIRFEGKEITPDMASIRVSNPNKVVAWGALYWQYFEQLDKIKTFEETPLTLKKQLFRVENSPTGEVLIPIAEGEKLNVGQKLKVRIELRVDRDMEYVHMKDMRAAGFEPVNVLSQYKWQGGLGYYDSTRDVSTNFFFSWLPKGTHVFEYPLRVTYNGHFSNGITTVQPMYAPEFTSHSEGIRVIVE